MATIYRTNGTEEHIEPKNGKVFSLEELNAVVNGYIEIVRISNGKLMVVNEEGKCLQLPYNEKATEILRDDYRVNRFSTAWRYASDFIVGDALLCDTDQIE